MVFNYQRHSANFLQLRCIKYGTDRGNEKYFLLMSSSKSKLEFIRFIFIEICVPQDSYISIQKDLIRKTLFARAVLKRQLEQV